MTNYTPEESIKRARENEDFKELADIYEYCYNHLEDWEEGWIDPSDLPHVGEGEFFSEIVGAIILRSIAFGCCWEEHVPADRGEN
jgi:hypothetical protein